MSATAELPTISSVSGIEAIIFDMDGVLFEGRNFWLDLHRRYGTEEAGIAAADAYLASDYASLAEVVVGKLWRGKPAAPLLQLVAARKYQAGVATVMGALKARGLATAIISSGPELLASRAQRDFGIDIVRANDIEIAAGHLTGRSTINVPDGGKAEVGRAVLQELDVVPERAASVGDGDSDAALARLVGLPIAYDSTSQTLDRVTRHHLRHGELWRLPELLD